MNLPKKELLHRGKVAFQKVPNLSPRKKTAFYAVCLAVLGALVYCILLVNGAFMVNVPAHGGTLREGMVGIPRFINPVLAQTEVDRDLSALVYSGLLKVSPSGQYVPDLAEDYSISDDGLSYTITLRKGLKWQDGAPVTADDVIFTIGKIQDVELNSPEEANWEGVRAEKVNDQTVVFHLKQPYGPFLQNLTVGILPQHLWKNKNTQEFIYSTYNAHPIGTGPFEVTHISSQSSGVPSEYDFSANPDYVTGKPYIDKVNVTFYGSNDDLENALEKHDIDSAAAIDPKVAKTLSDNGDNVETAPLLRIFGVFFNQSKNKIFTDTSVRRSLMLSVDKDAIVSEVLSGYGEAIDGPLPPGTIGNTEVATSTYDLAKAKSVLEDDGWTYDKDAGVYTKGSGDSAQTLSFTLSTSNVPDLVETADLLKKDWETLGAKVTIDSQEIGELNQNVIRTRNYEALLFGQIIGQNPDLYAFWHSSERLDPGLNVALYTNSEADTLLEDARQLTDVSQRNEKYQEFEEILKKEHPAVFLYAPKFIYVVPKNLGGINLGSVSIASDRFRDISNWYLETDHVWKFFTKEDPVGEAE